MAKRPQSVAIGVRSFRAGEIAHDDRRQHCQEQRRPPPRVEGHLLQPRWARHVSSSSSTCACACGSFTSSSPAAAASLLLRVDPSSSAGESSMFRHDRDSVLVRHAQLAVAVVVRPSSSCRNSDSRAPTSAIRAVLFPQVLLRRRGRTEWTDFSREEEDRPEGPAPTPLCFFA